MNKNSTNCENMPYEAIDVMSDHNYVDYMGKTIGNAYVLGKTTPHIKPNGNIKIRYLCRCNLCGKKFIAYRDSLTNHIKGKYIRPLSCGCDIARDPITVGEKIGKLTVVECTNVVPGKHERNTWKCKCECGRIVYMKEGTLLFRTTKDCGMCGEHKSRHEVYPNGTKIGMLTIRGYIPSKTGIVEDEEYICDCDCGTKGVIRTFLQLSGKDGCKNCGCVNVQKMKNLHDKTRRHGLSDTRIYDIYKGMMRRCYNTNEEMYYNYGGRGIYVCDEWKDQEDYKGLKAFVEWAYKNGYDDTLSIDRIDNDGPYCPDNCRWTTMVVQANNKRDSIQLTVGDTTYTYAQWEVASGINQNTIRRRCEKGYDPHTAVYTPTPTNHDCINAIYFVDEYNNPISQFDKE